MSFITFAKLHLLNIYRPAPPVKKVEKTLKGRSVKQYKVSSGGIRLKGKEIDTLKPQEIINESERKYKQYIEKHNINNI